MVQAHIDRLQKVDGLLRAAGFIASSPYDCATKLRDTRQLLRRAIDLLQEDLPATDKCACTREKTMVEEIAELVRETEQLMRNRLYSLAAKIMKELGHREMADDIQQCMFAENNEQHKEAKG